LWYFRTIHDTISTYTKTNVEIKPEKHGEFVVSFKLDDCTYHGNDIFRDHASFETEATAKVMMNNLFINILNKHQYKPVFTSDLR